MAELTSAQIRKEFNANLQAMNNSEKGRDAFRAEFADQQRASNLLMSAGGEDLGPLTRELSLCHTENGVCTALALFRETPLKNTLELSFLMAYPEHMEHLAGLLKEILNRFRKLYPDHDMVFSLVNRESRLLAERFFTKEMRVNRILTAVSFGET